jgi:endonuclease/exonuclease/phosphatase family metal-dependent hydrolase
MKEKLKNNKIKVVSYNICSLPYYINIFGNPRARINNIIKFIDNIDADILCLQEVFDNYIRTRLIRAFNKKYYMYYGESSVFYKMNNGLLTLSKFPIIYKKTIKFNNLSGEDYLSKKGIHYITVTVDRPGFPSKLTILNTHLNADAFFSFRVLCLSTRTKQLNQIIQLLNKINNNVLLCGDFNTDFNIDLIEEYNNIINTKKNSINSKRFVTFPDENRQLDYIFYLSNKKIKLKKNYKMYPTDTSDHNVLELLLTSS